VSVTMFIIIVTHVSVTFLSNFGNYVMS